MCGLRFGHAPIPRSLKETVEGPQGLYPYIDQGLLVLTFATQHW